MRDGNARWLDAVQLSSLIFVALALIPAGAHLFELPNKMRLPAEDYMIVQSIYRGWALFGIPIFAALAATLLHAVFVRANRRAMLFAFTAFLCIAATQAIFWTFTYPMNELTQNWTVRPADLEAARWQWEMSHAVNAGITFIAFVALSLSIFETRPVQRGKGKRFSAV